MLDQPRDERMPSQGINGLLDNPIMITSRRAVATDSLPINPSDDTASLLLNTFYLHVQARYPFLDYS